jgi:L-serine/L-threonine ammonia-lyase
VGELHVATPLWESAPLSRALGAEVWLKMEAFQPTGSFKLRGHGAACRAALAAGARRVVCSSGGNAGVAVAYAARRLGLEALVVVPRTTPEAMRERIRSEGAEVSEHGAVWDEAHLHALELAEGEETAYLHPFDDPLLWSGYAGLVREVAARGPRPASVVVAVGGGGLLCGVLEGLEAVGWGDVEVVAVETEGAASLAAAMEAGEPVSLEEITSVATSLGARRVAPQALAWTRRGTVRSCVVTDEAALAACVRFARDHRVLVEPACGAALAAVYGRAAVLEGRDPVGVIVCGGAGVDLERLAAWSAPGG